MSFALSQGKMQMCPLGVAPTSHIILPVNMVLGPSGPIANMNDKIPLVNLLPHGVCNVTAPVPLPCIPAVAAPFIPVPTVMIGSAFASKFSETGFCAKGGAINAIAPGQFQVMYS